MLQDEVLPLVEQKSFGEIRSMVKRIKESGLEKTLEEMRAVPGLSFADSLDRELSRVQKEYSAILSFQGTLGIKPRDKVVKRTRGVMRMMRAFIGRVKVENQQPLTESNREHAQTL